MRSVSKARPLALECGGPPFPQARPRARRRKERPNLLDWYGRVQELPAYSTAVGDWLAPPFVNMMRTNGEAVWDEVEPLTRPAD